MRALLVLLAAIAALVVVVSLVLDWTMRATVLSMAGTVLLLEEFAVFWWAEARVEKSGRGLRSAILAVFLLAMEGTLLVFALQVGHDGAKIFPAVLVGALFVFAVFAKLLLSLPTRDLLAFLGLSFVPLVLAHAVALFLVVIAGLIASRVG